MYIDSHFDGGNIEVINCDDSNDIQLAIRADKCADYRQWFYFRCVVGGEGDSSPCVFKIMNAGEASFEFAWDEGSIVASYDKEDWFRINTDYQGGVLTFDLQPEQAIFYVALYVPYSYERHNQLIGWALEQPQCGLLDAATSVEGRPIELLGVPASPAAGKANIWLIARQHPAETMAEWFMEGVLETLLDPHNPVSRTLIDKYNFFIVPNMNPDGSVAGNLRTNGAGVDLNRSWLNPDPDKSPESAFVLNKMDELGVNLFLDIHGDEEIPFVFAMGCEGVPGYSEQLVDMDNKFRQTLHSINPDFRTEPGYEDMEHAEADMSVACFQVGQRFNCLSLTFEMPFKDNKYLPDERYGWSTERCKLLASSTLTALNQTSLS